MKTLQHLRPLRSGERVFIYRNLHARRGERERGIWSIRSLEPGADYGCVIAHSDHVRLSCATFKVSEAGRQRVLRERRKNVHAGVVGYVYDLGLSPATCDRMRAVSYNPYKAPTFYEKDSGATVRRADFVDLAGPNVKAI